MDEQQLQTEIGEVRERAQRRYRKRLPLILAAALPVGVVAGLLSGRSNHGSHHHRTVAVTVIGLLVVLVGIGILIWTLRSRTWRDRYRPSLMLGLDKPERTRAVRGLRRGVPDADPVLREVQVRSARRLTGQRRLILWFYPALIVILIGSAATSAADGRSWLVQAAGAVLLAGAWPRSLLLLRRSRALLDSVGAE